MPRMEPPSVDVRWRWLTSIARALPVIAFCLSAYLAWTSLMQVPAYGCSGERSLFDCGHVLGSRWGKWLGIPVAGVGLVVYSALAGLCWVIGNRSHVVPSALRALLVLLVTLAAGSGLWFLWIQLFQIRQICPYCMVIHGCGIGLALYLIVEAWREARTTGSSRRFPLAFVGGCIPLALLIAGQLAFPGSAMIELDNGRTFRLTRLGQLRYCAERHGRTK